MQEMLYPPRTSRPWPRPSARSSRTGVSRAARADLCIGHISPEAAAGGAIGLIEDGDEIAISIPDRSMTLCISDEELAARRARRDELGWYPESREREVSQSLKIYASLAQSADRGAARRRI